MKLPWRLIAFLVGAAGLGLLYALAVSRMTGPARQRDRYAQAINHLTVPQRNTTDAVTAVNFDYRGFDTLGEEFILFVSVMGTMVLLREAQEKEGPLERDAICPERDVPPGDAIRVWILAMVGPKVLFGLYVVTHGQLTPGGGFQGGVILATAPLIIYTAESFQFFKQIISVRLVEITEAVGAGGYALIGMLGWLFGREFLTNVLPLGQSGVLTAGGTIALISLATGLEVAAGFVLLLVAFLQETLAAEGRQS